MKKLSFLFALFLSACGGSDSSPPIGTPPPSEGNCVNYDSKAICLIGDDMVKSGELVTYEIQGSLGDRTVNWHLTTEDGVLLPPYIKRDNAITFIVPPVMDTSSMEISSTWDESDGNGTLSKSIQISPGSSLYFSGFKSVHLDADGIVQVTWLPAVSDNSEIVDTIIYEIIAESEDGDLIQDETVDTRISLDLKLGETYTLTLVVKGVNETSSLPMEYIVPETKPEFAKIQTWVQRSMPPVDQFERHDLVNISGELYILREDVDGNLYWDLAETYEIYKESAPLHFKSRHSSLSDYERVAFANAGMALSRSIHGRSVRSSDLKLCLKSEDLPQDIEGSICMEPRKLSFSCENDFKLSVMGSITQSCTVQNPIEVEAKLGEKVSVTLPIIAEWMTHLLPTGHPVHTALKVSHELKFGAKLEAEVPFAVNFGLGFTNNTTLGYELNWAGPILYESSPVIDTFISDVKPLNDGKWLDIELPTFDVEKEYKFTSKIGIFPKFEVGKSSELTADISVGLQFDLKKVNINGAEDKINYPVFPTTGGKVDVNWYFGAGLGKKIVFDFEKSGMIFNAYTHPTQLDFLVIDRSQCTGSYTYNGEYPIESVPAYGVLNPGGKYGKGWLQNDKVLISTSKGLRFDSVDVEGDGRHQVEVQSQQENGYHGIQLVYENLYDKTPVSVVSMMKLEQFSPLGFGSLMPVYVVMKTGFHQGPASHPWVCWGKGYTPKESRDTFKMSLFEALYIDD